MACVDDRSLESAEARLAESQERLQREEVVAQQRIATLERSLLQSVNELRLKTR